MANERRSGESWGAFMKQYRLRGIADREDGGWDVTSTSEQTYIVRSVPRIDRGSGSMYFETTCTCPARKRCRHIEAVLNMREAEASADEDSDGMEMVERTEF